MDLFLSDRARERHSRCESKLLSEAFQGWTRRTASGEDNVERASTPAQQRDSFQEGSVALLRHMAADEENRGVARRRVRFVGSRELLDRDANMDHVELVPCVGFAQRHQLASRIVTDAHYESCVLHLFGQAEV